MVKVYTDESGACKGDAIVHFLQVCPRRSRGTLSEGLTSV